jgi:hypothetical protein
MNGTPGTDEVAIVSFVHPVRLNQRGISMSREPGIPIVRAQPTAARP